MIKGKVKISEKRGVRNICRIWETHNILKLRQSLKQAQSWCLLLYMKHCRKKGYNPVNQIVGYIMSGDPTYITSHKNARSLIMKVERDELVEELLTEYIRARNWK